MSKYNLFVTRSSILFLSLLTLFTKAEYQKLRAEEADSNTTIESIFEENPTVEVEVEADSNTTTESVSETENPTLEVEADSNTTTESVSETENPTLEVESEADSNTTIEEISESENIIVGEKVTVRGKVEEVESGVSFALEEDGFFDRDKILVINVSEKMLPAEANDLGLQVTGEIGMLILANVEQEYGLDLDPELYVDYENKPVVFATSMVLSPDLEEVAENPDLYYSQEIAVKGEVKNINTDNAFILREDKLFSNDNLLIINATGEPIPAQDEKVVVTGTVRPFIKTEFERDYNLTWDLDIQEEIEAEYTEKPVLVVDSIYPSAQEQSLFE